VKQYKNDFSFSLSRGVEPGPEERVGRRRRRKGREKSSWSKFEVYPATAAETIMVSNSSFFV
jgi:hypothetical protein